MPVEICSRKRMSDNIVETNWKNRLDFKFVEPKQLIANGKLHFDLRRVHVRMHMDPKYDKMNLKVKVSLHCDDEWKSDVKSKCGRDADWPKAHHEFKITKKNCLKRIRIEVFDHEGCFDDIPLAFATVPARFLARCPGEKRQSWFQLRFEEEPLEAGRICFFHEMQVPSECEWISNPHYDAGAIAAEVARQKAADDKIAAKRAEMEKLQGDERRAKEEEIKREEDAAAKAAADEKALQAQAQMAEKAVWDDYYRAQEFESKAAECEDEARKYEEEAQMFRDTGDNGKADEDMGFAQRARDCAKEMRAKADEARAKQAEARKKREEAQAAEKARKAQFDDQMAGIKADTNA